MNTQGNKPVAEMYYINLGTHRVVYVTEVTPTSVRFHTPNDDYMYVDSLYYFMNDFRQYQEG